MLNKGGTLYTDTVRSKVKKAILLRVHESYRHRVEQSSIAVHRTELGIRQKKQLLQDGAILVVVISSGTPIYSNSTQRLC
jgi:hypothetical protein